MRINETFTSIQGEGPVQGRVASFIRLSGCNLKCDFCDTPYAQSLTEGHNLEGITEAIDFMLAARERYGNNHNFVITGGEPLLQPDAVFLLLGNYFARSAKRANVWFETNGTIAPKKDLVVRFTPRFVVSPKKGHLNLEALQALALLEAHFKFVIDSKGKHSFTFEEALAVVASLKVVPRSHVWMQPMGAKALDVTREGRLVWLQCVEHGVNFSPRLQTMLFGAKRGV